MTPPVSNGGRTVEYDIQNGGRIQLQVQLQKNPSVTTNHSASKMEVEFDYKCNYKKS